MKQRKSIINNSDNDNYSVSSSAMREKDESESRRGLTSLDPNTVRYLNKRKPSDKSNSAYTFHATRANAVSSKSLLILSLFFSSTIQSFIYYSVTLNSDTSQQCYNDADDIRANLRRAS
jgi:hypothetical protein